MHTHALTVNVLSLPPPGPGSCGAPQVTVIVRDVKLPRAVGWLNKGIKMVIKDSGKKQAASTLQHMVKAKSTPGL